MSAPRHPEHSIRTAEHRVETTLREQSAREWRDVSPAFRKRVMNEIREAPARPIAARSSRPFRLTRGPAQRGAPGSRRPAQWGFSLAMAAGLLVVTALAAVLVIAPNGARDAVPHQQHVTEASDEAGGPVGPGPVSAITRWGRLPRELLAWEEDLLTREGRAMLADGLSYGEAILDNLPLRGRVPEDPADPPRP